MIREKSFTSLAAALKAGALSIGLLAVVCAIAALAVSGCDPCPSCTHVVPVPTGPHFVLSGSMTDSRLLHSATLLDTGEVLVAGGGQLPGTLDVAEIYNPANGSFVATAGAMTQARHHHTATLLNDDTVLVAGGDNGGGILIATAFLTAELYDPATDKFEATGTMFSPRTWQTATLLGDGKVLMAGGSPAVDSTINPTTKTGTGLPVNALPNAELYDPATKQFFGNSGAMNNARTEHSASLIKNCGCTKENEVLMAGGVDASGQTLSSAELFNESNNSFTVTGRMNLARHNHTATTLHDGRVLITGGVNNSLVPLDSAEIYDPKTETFTLTRPMTTARAFHSAQLLHDGRVLISGGVDLVGGFVIGLDSAEVFNPSTGAFTAAGLMTAARAEQPSVLLPNGNVLVPGGALLFNTVGVLEPFSSLDSADIFSTATSRFSATPQNMVRPRVGHAATALKDGRILITGGADLTGQIFDTSELYDPGRGSFSCVGGATGKQCAASLHDVRYFQTATALKGSAQVLLAGGSDGTTLATAEIYNAASKTYSCVGGVSSAPPICNDSMVSARINQVAVRLLNGETLLAGGDDTTGSEIASAELYNPATGKFTATGSLNTPRAEFAAALFTSGPLAGQVLISGGCDPCNPPNPNDFAVLRSAELYDPGTGQFTVTGSMAEFRFDHSETLLGSGPNSGSILVAAGSGDQTAEIYNPATRTFKAAGDMTQIIFSPVVATLGSGQVLLAGGSTFNSLGQIAPVSGAELYDPASNKFTNTSSLNNARLFAAGAFLDPALVSGSEAGDALVTGGQGTNSTLASSELFVPGSSTTSTTAAAATVPALTPEAMQQKVAEALAAMSHQLAISAKPPR